MNAVRQERTGWRDADLSARHRQWGWDCPAVDLDFLLVEYHVGKPVAMIEYKYHLSSTPLNLKHPTYRALIELCNIAQLPFLIAYYWKGIWAFRVVPANMIAAEKFQHNELLTERQFVTRLYRMRRLVLAKEIEPILKDFLPPTEMARGLDMPR